MNAEVDELSKILGNLGIRMSADELHTARISIIKYVLLNELKKSSNAE